MKKIVKNSLVSIFGWQVRRLIAKNDFQIVAIVGSVGKTSTKFAVARVLSEGRKVRWQEGNYNDHLSVPLVFFGQTMPNILNPFAWIKIFIRNEKVLRQKYPYEVVVIELGTDGPGQISAFKKYILNDIAVVTSVAPEHMENFKDIQAVANEELSVELYSNKLVVNSDLVKECYLSNRAVPVISVGANTGVVRIRNTKLGAAATFALQYSSEQIAFTGSFYSKAEVYSAALAAVVARELGVDNRQVKEAVTKLRPVPGRMQRLKGANDSLIIDDTYNASPDAMIAALDTLYDEKAAHKIALLGNMNELGVFAKTEHERVGGYCDPKKLELVATLGPEANSYLAAVAEAKGCKVKRFNSPYELGEYVKTQLKKNTVILAKGSQNNVYMEEAVKMLLKNPDDQKKLVRQSTAWAKVKAKNFERV